MSGLFKVGDEVVTIWGDGVGRVAMDDAEWLLRLIRESIDEQTNTNQ